MPAEMNLSTNSSIPNLFTNDFLNRVNPYIRRAWYSTLLPHEHIGERVIYDYEIMLIKSGAAVIHIDGESYETQEGDVFIFRPGQRHAITVLDEPLVQPHIHFDFCYAPDSPRVHISYKTLEKMSIVERSQIREDVTSRFNSHFPSCIHLNNPLYVEQLIFDVISTYCAPTVHPEIQLKWRFLRLLDQLLSEICWRQSDHAMYRNERAMLIRNYLEYHADRRVTLHELAQVYHVDKSYISKTFSETFHVSPMHYHLQCRIAKAKTMLQYTNISLTDIADKTGFSCPQDFSRTFRRLEGMSPSEFRRAAISNATTMSDVEKIGSGGGNGFYLWTEVNAA